MPLVEIVPNPGTSEESIQLALAFYQSVGKKPIVVRQETPGFVANRLQAALNQEAFSLVQRGIVSAKDIG
jgi:3-hydroxyacyl-CoA dehydrogenase